MTSTLILSHRKAANCTAINRQATDELQTYQMNVIRFIYDCFIKKKHGAILNIDTEMNHEHTCSLAVKTLYDVRNNNATTIILCNEDRLLYWLYYMKKYSEREVFKITDNNIERLLKRNEALILIIVEKDFKIFRNHVKNHNYFCLIVDQIDDLIEKQLTGRINADFRIGVTHRNFIRNRDQKKHWKILNWATPTGTFSKLADFIEYDDAYLKERIDPYTAYWYTMTWKYCDQSIDKSLIMENNEQQRQLITTWSKSAGMLKVPTSPNKQQEDNKKADHNKNKSNSTLSSNDCCFDCWWDVEMPDLSIFDAGRQSLNASTTSTISTSPTMSMKKINKLQIETQVNHSSTIRKTKSLFVFDRALVEEFSKPFQCATQPLALKACTSSSSSMKKSQSDSALIICNQKSKDVLEDLHDIEVLQEFSRNFELTSMGNDSSNVNNDNKIVDVDETETRLGSLLSGHIDSDSDDNYISQFISDSPRTGGGPVLTISAETIQLEPSDSTITSVGIPKKRCFNQIDSDEEFLTKYIRGDGSQSRASLITHLNLGKDEDYEEFEEENFLLAFL